MIERFTFKDGKYYDKEQELDTDGVLHILNDDSKEVDRLLQVIQDLHTDIRNLGLNKRKQEQIIRIQYEIINNYKELFDVTNGKWYIKEQR